MCQKTFPENKYLCRHRKSLGVKVIQCLAAIQRGSDCDTYIENHNIEATTKREPCAECLYYGIYVHNGQSYVLRA